MTPTCTNPLKMSGETSVVIVSEPEPAHLCLSTALCFELEATTEERNYSFGRVQKSCNKAFFFIFPHYFGQKMEMGFN